MDTSETSAPHETRLLRVIDHIYRHMAGDLSLDTLSDVAAMSRFHWHRTYKGLAGETIGETIRRVRLNNAARELVQSQEPVVAIAQRCGYPSRRSFERAFVKAYHLAPAEFRQRGVATRPEIDRPVVEIICVERTPQTVATLIHTGRYEEAAPTMHRLRALSAARGFRRFGPPVGVFIESGSEIPQHLRRALVGLPVETSNRMSAPLRPFTIRGAVTRLDPTWARRRDCRRHGSGFAGHALSVSAIAWAEDHALRSIAMTPARLFPVPY